MNIFSKQAEFLSAAEVPSGNSVNPIATALIEEEYNEWSAEDQYGRTGNHNDLKECLDLMYVCAQYMNESVGPEKATKLFEAIHANNMDKCVGGKLVKDANTGKVLKPKGFNKNAWKNDFTKILGKFE